MIDSRFDDRIWHVFTSAGVFIFFSLSLAIPSGYSYGAVALLLIACAYLLNRPKLELSREDKLFAYLLLCSFLVALGAFLIHDNEPNTLDQSSRYLLFIPILLLLLSVPLCGRALWVGLIVGALGALGLALWQRYVEGVLRPDGFMTSAIPFGNLSLMSGILCLTAMGWAETQHRHVKLWRFFLFVGFISGIYVSLLSGSRGGWLALPIVLVIFLVAFFRKDRLKTVVLGAFLLVVALAAAGMSLRQEITVRYDEAVTDMENYASEGIAATSVGIRLETWRATVKIIGERPLIGWSHDDYESRLRALAASNEADPLVTTLANTHNNFLEVWLHQGLLGLLVFLALLLGPFWLFCKRLRNADCVVQAFALGGACLAACFFIFSLTQVILGRNNGVIYFGVSLVILWGGMRKAEQQARRQLGDA